MPPATTKVGLTAKGGYQAEVHWFLCGLDIMDKARMTEAQCRRMLRPYSSKFSKLAFTVNGSAADNASNQNAATVDFRIFVQAPNAEDISPEKFFRPVVDPIMVRAVTPCTVRSLENVRCILTYSTRLCRKAILAQHHT